MRFTFYAALIIFCASCNSSSSDRKDGFSETAKNPEDSLFQEVMDQHDVAMSKMGKLAGYRKQIDQKLDSLKKIKSAAKVTAEKKLQAINADLKNAEDKMNAWMHEFSIDSAQDDTERRIRYLTDEKLKVSRVKDEILGAISEADSALKK